MGKANFIKGITIYGHQSVINFFCGDIIISKKRNNNLEYVFTIDSRQVGEKHKAFFEAYSKEFFGIRFILI